MRDKCKQVIIEAGQKLLEIKNLKIEEKTDFRNLVTSYDTMTQDFLMKELGKINPAATFLCEENGEQNISDCMFIVDPIDGTANFVHQLNFSAISVGYVEDGSLKWGIVYSPFLNELFEGERGKGAFLNGKPIKVTDQPLQNSIVAFGTSPYNVAYKEETLEMVSEVLKYSMDVRRFGSAALDLCYVAAGRTGLYFEKELQAWDLAGGMAIALEAGARLMDMDLKQLDYTKKNSIIAGSPANVEEFIEKVLGKRG